MFNKTEKKKNDSTSMFDAINCDRIEYESVQYETIEYEKIKYKTIEYEKNNKEK